MADALTNKNIGFTLFKSCNVYSFALFTVRVPNFSNLSWSPVPPLSSPGRLRPGRRTHRSLNYDNDNHDDNDNDNEHNDNEEDSPAGASRNLRE